MFVHKNEVVRKIKEFVFNSNIIFQRKWIYVIIINISDVSLVLKSELKLICSIIIFCIRTFWDFIVFCIYFKKNILGFILFKKYYYIVDITMFEILFF